MTTIRSKTAALAVALVAAGGLAALSPAGPAVADNSLQCELLENTTHYNPDGTVHDWISYYDCPDGEWSISWPPLTVTGPK
jgi:hypothetical protein